MAGRMIETKGLPTLQLAFEIIRKKSQQRIQLWLCGEPDPGNPGSWNAARLNAWCRENSNVIWKGHQDMAAIWPQVHLALQPSYGGEGLPKALLEAGACGRAMIASDISGCREVVENGRNGYLTPEADAQALAEAILKIAADPEGCAAMGRESRKIVEGDLSAASVSQSIGALYRRITG
jgi:glycosyltransferase involved in cell wall biosynthesis